MAGDRFGEEWRRVTAESRERERGGRDVFISSIVYKCFHESLFSRCRTFAVKVLTIFRPRHDPVCYTSHFLGFGHSRPYTLVRYQRSHHISKHGDTMLTHTIQLSKMDLILHAEVYNNKVSRPTDAKRIEKTPPRETRPGALQCLLSVASRTITSQIG